MKRFLQILGLIILLGFLAAVIVVAVIHFGGQTNKKAGVSACSPKGHIDHAVVIKNSEVLPEHTDATRCDTLTITSDDTVTRLMAFGQHDHHQAYDGVTEKILTKGQTMTVTLDQVGSFRFHDHLHDEVQGTFSVH